MTTPMDGDAGIDVAVRRPGTRTGQIPTLAAISVGGACGALARYGIGAAWPHATPGFAWSTFVINVTGCLLLGLLMVIVTEVVPHRRLVRPFLGVGVLGGYTTFSTYIVDISKNASAGAALTALVYLAGTAVAALLAVWAGNAAAAAVVRRAAAREQGGPR